MDARMEAYRENGGPPAGARPDGDAALVARVLAGDREAFSVLARRHQESLFRYARGMVLDADTAADMVQDALVRAYRQLAECKDAGAFRSWLFRILRNRCLDHLRDVRRTEIPLDELPHAEASTAAGPAVAMPHDDLRLTLAGAFARLPETLRDAFLLKHLAGYSYDEMAGIAGGSVSAMKMRVHRAREALRACLVEDAVGSDEPTPSARP